MKSTINIFLMFYILITAQSLPTQIQTPKTKYQPNQHISLYDYFRNKLEDFQNDYQKNGYYVDVNKRTSNEKYIPLYDKFKKRLDSFNAALLLDNDKQVLANRNNLRRFGGCLNATENISNSGKKIRSNLGFLNFLGFNKKSKEDDMAKLKELMQPQLNKLQNNSQPINKPNEFFKTKSKHIPVKVQPGNLYEEYERQIKKVNDELAKDMKLQNNSIFKSEHK